MYNLTQKISKTQLFEREWFNPKNKKNKKLFDRVWFKFNPKIINHSYIFDYVWFNPKVIKKFDQKIIKHSYLTMDSLTQKIITNS